MSVDFFIFVPAYNVATTLAPVLQKVSDEVWNRSIVLVIDDGSVDDTRGSFENFVAALDSEFAGALKKSRLRYMRYFRRAPLRCEIYSLSAWRWAVSGRTAGRIL